MDETVQTTLTTDCRPGHLACHGTCTYQGTFWLGQEKAQIIAYPTRERQSLTGYKNDSFIPGAGMGEETLYFYFSNISECTVRIVSCGSDMHRPNVSVVPLAEKGDDELMFYFLTLEPTVEVLVFEIGSLLYMFSICEQSRLFGSISLRES